MSITSIKSLESFIGISETFCRVKYCNASIAVGLEQEGKPLAKFSVSRNFQGNLAGNSE